MRKETKRIVRTYTTGIFEADMLGHLINVSEEVRDKQNNPQRPHSKKLKERQYKSGLRAALDRYGERYQTAPTACWRSLNVLINKGNVIYTRVVNRVRKLFVNS